MDLVPFPKPEPEIKTEEEVLDEVKPELESEEELPDELKSELESEEELPDDLKSEIESEEEVLDELLKEDEIKSVPQDSLGIDQEAECATVLISADGKCVIVCQACNGFFDDIDPFRNHVEKVHSDYVVRGNAWGKIIKEEPTEDKTIDMTGNY